MRFSRLLSKSFAKKLWNTQFKICSYSMNGAELGVPAAGFYSSKMNACIVVCVFLGEVSSFPK